jgi:uncharacterized protein DUF692
VAALAPSSPVGVTTPRPLAGRWSMFRAMPSEARGVGFQVNFFTRPLLDELEREGARIDYLELLCDTVSGSLDGPHLVEPRHAAWLADLKRRYPLVAHSNFGEEFGFAELEDTPCVRRHIPIAREMGAAWMTDHMFSATQSTSYLWSTPVQFSTAEIRRIAARARTLQRMLGMPLLHENALIYAVFPGSELGEAEFLAGLVERAGERTGAARYLGAPRPGGTRPRGTAAVQRERDDLGEHVARERVGERADRQHAQRLGGVQLARLVADEPRGTTERAERP